MKEALAESVFDPNQYELDNKSFSLTFSIDTPFDRPHWNTFLCMSLQPTGK